MVLDAAIVLLTVLIGAESAVRSWFALNQQEVPTFLSSLMSPWMKDGWGTVAAIALVIALVLRIISEFRIRAEDKRAKDGIQNHYSVMVAELADVLRAPSSTDSLESFRDFIQELPKHLSGLAGSKRDYVEVQIFQREFHDDHVHLVPRFSNETKLSSNHYSMRKQGNTAAYPDAVSKQVWEKAHNGDIVYHQNLRWWTLAQKKNLPANWQRFAKHRYGTFITAPIRGGKRGDEVVGLLTINSEISYALTEIDASLVELAAWMIQLGNETCGYFDHGKTYDGIIRNGPKKMDSERCRF